MTPTQAKALKPGDVVRFGRGYSGAVDRVETEGRKVRVFVRGYRHGYTPNDVLHPTDADRERWAREEAARAEAEAEAKLRARVERVLGVRPQETARDIYIDGDPRGWAVTLTREQALRVVAMIDGVSDEG